MVDRGKSGWCSPEREESRKGTVKTRKEERGKVVVGEMRVREWSIKDQK